MTSYCSIIKFIHYTSSDYEFLVTKNIKLYIDSKHTNINTIFYSTAATALEAYPMLQKFYNNNELYNLHKHNGYLQQQ